MMIHFDNSQNLPLISKYVLLADCRVCNPTPKDSCERLQSNLVLQWLEYSRIQVAKTKLLNLSKLKDIAVIFGEWRERESSEVDI